MPETVVLVSCVKTKLSRELPAHQLYSSDWFKKASAYAGRISGRWYILSAEYGLVHPDKVISPYETTLSKMSLGERRTWARNVMAKLKLLLNDRDEIVLLAGINYREFLAEPLKDDGYVVQMPLEGLRFGEQKSWLKHRLEELDA